MKQGADKRRITENSEILALFQDSGSYQPDAAGVNGKEFKVTIPRTIQKSDSTTQKEALKDSDTIQKSDSTTQKDLDPSQVKVLNFFREHPKATIDEMVAGLNDLSLGGVKFIIAKLQKKGLLKRVGGRKYGEWQVLI